MAVVLGLDIGTTTITSLAIDGDTGESLGAKTTANDSRFNGLAPGRCEFDAERIWTQAIRCLNAVSELLGHRASEVVGVGMTGQQHGVVLVDENLKPVSPYINWQDQRGADPHPDGGTYVDALVGRLGNEQYQRHGCYLRTGFMGLTLTWLADNGQLPENCQAAFIMDFVASRLCQAGLTSDPTAAGSAGVLDIHENQWNEDAIGKLGWSSKILPRIGSVRETVGSLTAEIAQETGLPADIPVFTALGDNQASFLGSVSHRHSQLSINVGTGGQVGAYSEKTGEHPALEVRPFPYGGFLLANVGACGGRSYAALERFFRLVGESLFDVEVEGSLFARMTDLAAGVTNGTHDMTCLPLFTGTRQDPDVRANWSGIDPDNFTPANMVLSLLEGMASVFFEGYEAIQSIGVTGMTEIVGAGNGIRENEILQHCIEKRFEMPVLRPAQREEAATGAAISAAIGTGLLPDLSATAKWLSFES